MRRRPFVFIAEIALQIVPNRIPREGTDAMNVQRSQAFPRCRSLDTMIISANLSICWIPGLAKKFCAHATHSGPGSQRSQGSDAHTPGLFAAQSHR